MTSKHGANSHNEVAVARAEYAREVRRVRGERVARLPYQRLKELVIQLHDLRLVDEPTTAAGLRIALAGHIAPGARRDLSYVAMRRALDDLPRFADACSEKGTADGHDYITAQLAALQDLIPQVLPTAVWPKGKASSANDVHWELLRRRLGRRGADKTT
jgi:hypothetical protein